MEKQLLLDLYRKMVSIRKFEEKGIELYSQNLMRGSLHLYIGEEAIAAGVCQALRRDDYVTSYHRGHGHTIAKGGDMGRMFAEMLGKETGYCKGRGGSMHIADFEIGMLGANGIVGGGIPIAVGAGLSSKLQGNDRVTVCFFGDGASNEGAFHEAINLAAVWELPVVFVCENNQYGETNPHVEACSVENVGDRACAYGIPGVVIDGNDVLAVYGAATTAVERARSGGGPTIIEGKTYRWYGHFYGESSGYRTKDEIEEWKLKDPVVTFRAQVISTGGLPEEEFDKIDAEVQQTVDQAAEFAVSSPEPNPEEAMEYIYV